MDGEEYDDLDAPSVATVDVGGYAREMNHNQSNRFPANLGYKGGYIQNKWQRARGRRPYGRRGRGRGGGRGRGRGRGRGGGRGRNDRGYSNYGGYGVYNENYKARGGGGGGYRGFNRKRGHGGYRGYGGYNKYIHNDIQHNTAYKQPVQHGRRYGGYNNYGHNDMQQGGHQPFKEMGYKRSIGHGKHNYNNDQDQEPQNVDVNNKSPWNATKEEISEVRKYGSYEFYLNADVKTMIRYQNKIILMKNDYDETIFGAFVGDMEDWEEWFHGYCHDAFNKKNINYFKTKLMPITMICGKYLKDGTDESKEIMRRIVHEMAISGWTQGVEYMHQLFGDAVFTVLSRSKHTALHQAAYKFHHDTVSDMIKMGAKYDAKSGYDENIAEVAKVGFYDTLNGTPLIPLVRCHTAPQLINQLNLNDVNDDVDEKKNEEQYEYDEYEGIGDLTIQKLDDLIKTYYEEGAAKSKKKAGPFNELRITENIRLSDKQYEERVTLLTSLIGSKYHTFAAIPFSLESCYYGTIMDVYYYVCSFYINCWYKAKDTGNQRWLFSQCLNGDDGNVYGTISCKQQQLNGRILTVIPEGGQKRLELREKENDSKPSDNQLFRFEYEKKCDENGYKIWCRIISKNGYALMIDYDETPYSNASLRIRNAVIRCTQSFPDPQCRDLFTPFPYTTSNRKTSKIDIAYGNKQYNIGDYKILFQHCKFWKKNYKQFNKIQCYAASVYLIGQIYDKCKLNDNININKDRKKLEKENVEGGATAYIG